MTIATVSIGRIQSTILIDDAARSCSLKAFCFARMKDFREGTRVDGVEEPHCGASAIATRLATSRTSDHPKQKPWWRKARVARTRWVTREYTIHLHKRPWLVLPSMFLCSFELLPSKPESRHASLLVANFWIGFSSLMGIRFTDWSGVWYPNLRLHIQALSKESYVFVTVLVGLVCTRFDDATQSFSPLRAEVSAFRPRPMLHICSDAVLQLFLMSCIWLLTILADFCSCESSS